jgi:hypothetical protein
MVPASHLRDGTRVVSDSFIKSAQSLRSVESRSIIGEQDFFMAKYAIGEVVKRTTAGAAWFGRSSRRWLANSVTQLRMKVRWTS